MPYVHGVDRDQLMFCSLDSFVDQECEARLIDAFVDSLNLGDFGIEKSKAANEGRPSYNPKSLLKLYIYGYQNGIRSSRKLADGCRLNVEIRWMMYGVEPDFRTISDFRKNNVSAMKDIFRAFNKRISEAIEWGFASVDGSKFKACNSKSNNFTENKLDDRLARLNAHIEEYIRKIDEADAAENEASENDPSNLSKEELEQKLKEAKERVALYESYRKRLDETGNSQISVTDPDSRLMKSKNGFVVAYNPQTAVDSESHLIRDYEMTNQVTDHGLLEKTLDDIRETTSDGIVECVADKGYHDNDDIAACLEKGIVPNVIMDDGKDYYELEMEYEKSDCNPASETPEEIGKCLRNGIIPNVYHGIIEEAEIEKVKKYIRGESTKAPEGPYGSDAEMIERAKEGYFVRDPERNFVYCPNGSMLRQKSIKNNGNIRYANKMACKNCVNRHKCYKGKGEWKEIDFSKDCLEKPCKEWLKAECKDSDCKQVNTKSRWEKRIVVKIKFKPNIEKMSQRKCLSEHPFGTIKRAMGAGYFLLRGINKVDGEFALMCLGYNLRRSFNLFGFKKMIKMMINA